MKIYENLSFDQERALYGERDICVKNCRFDGPADGESAFKEGGNIKVDSCYFNLRYPFWHCDGVRIDNSEMTELCRAALWYSNDIDIRNSRLHGIKALRECERIIISDCDVVSPEFGWFSRDIGVTDSSFVSEYFMLRATDIKFNSVSFKGKYSFQYIENSVFENCNFDTKDAFWHAKNVTVRNSVVKGEYLAWYCENVTFENCEIIGTQPLCYCKNLKLINCTMRDCDLSFEKSSVVADIIGHIDSVKNPESGRITADTIGEVIAESGACQITEKSKEYAAN
ncbi:MAG: DUF3737 family protein [Clostridia bacterium]|nr:DUF3737 family protein [Clostridia bacterium]